MEIGFPAEFGQSGYLPPRGRIQAGYWRGFKDLVGRRGGSHREILERHEIDPETFEFHDYHVDCSAALNMLEYCSLHLDDPLFGLHLADAQQPDAFGCVTVVARAAPTFGESLRCLVDYTPVTNSPEGVMELVTSGNFAELRWSSDFAGGGCEQAHYHGLLLIMKTLRLLGGSAFGPSRVSLCCDARGAWRQEIEDKAGCAITTRSGANAIAFPVELLDTPNLSRNAMVFALLSSCLTQIGDARPRSVIEDVACFIRTALPEGRCSIENCAAKLGTTTRTLQKLLSASDTSFSFILEQQRDVLARKSLSGSRSSIDEIAFDLGYSEQSSFGRAFKRWTGLSPQAFRTQSHRTQ